MLTYIHVYIYIVKNEKKASTDQKKVNTTSEISPLFFTC